MSSKIDLVECDACPASGGCVSTCMKAAPVAECQPPEKIDHPNFLEFAICDTCGFDKFCCEMRPIEHLCSDCYWAPINAKTHADELAKLQAKCELSDIRISQLTVAIDQSSKAQLENYHMATRAWTESKELQATIDRLTAENERLKGGQSEAVATVVDFGSKEGWIPEGIVLQWCAGVDHKKYIGAKLFASQPAPVSAVLPDEMGQPSEACSNKRIDAYIEGWNACLDKVKELNG